MPRIIGNQNEVAAASNADKVDNCDVSSDVNLGTSDVLIPTQNAVKYYIDNQSAVGEQNVQSNWNETNSSSDAFVQNKPGAMGSSNSYALGFVPAGSATHNDTYLRKDGTWASQSIAAGSVGTAELANEAVTYGKTRFSAGMKVLGRLGTGSGVGQEIALLDEDNMSTNSATSLATQQSIKAYVDANAGAGSITGLSDTTITGTPANDEILAWDGSSKWINQTAAEAGLQTALTSGISDTNNVVIDSNSVADDEYARFTANGLESRSTTEVKSDLSLVASDVGLGNVTNESKATMFANSALTGTTTGVNLTLSGDLTVNGSTTTLSTNNTVIEDNLIELNNGATSNANDSGIVIERGSTGDNAFIGWDESADGFILGTTTATGSDTGNLSITAGNLAIGTITAGTWQGTAVADSYIASAATWNGKIANLSEDTSPQLGNHLDVNGYDIISAGGNNIDLDPNAAGKVVFKGNATRGSGQFVLNCENNSHGIIIKGPPHSAAATYTLTLPNDTGSSNQALLTNGSGVLSWGNVDSLPSQSSQSGKYLTTDGSTASWAAVTALPSQSGNANKVLTTDGTNAAWDEYEGSVLNQTISASKTIPSGNSFVIAGPVTVASGQTLTVSGTMKVI